jgi:hypothetical protein
MIEMNTSREEHYRNLVETAAINSDYSKLTADVEDTEPEKNFGFLEEPHEDLYPCAFRGTDKISPAVAKILKDHVLESIATEYDDPDEWIYFTVYGSGISYNWNEDGDFDIQMWIDYSKFQDNDTPVTADDLLADTRRLLQLVNFPSFADLGLQWGDSDGKQLVQYYGKLGTGSKEENLASNPYACYDLETGEWLVHPEPLTPQFYGEMFILVMPKAQDVAVQAEAALDDLDRNITSWQFWTGLNNEHPDERYQAEADKAKDEAEQIREGIHNLFLGVFEGRKEAYGPGGKGINDERDVVQKLLEVWGIFQKLKHYGRAKLPWEETDDEPQSPLDGQATEQEEKSDADTNEKKTQYENSDHWTIVADWDDVQDKAVNYYRDGQVQIHLNAPDHVIGTVNSETSPGQSYQTEIWRDDPNSDAITLWSCTCPWGEVSWGRTRQWKKYEGRPCAHVTALQWAAKSSPQPVDEQGNEQLQIPGTQPVQPIPDVTPSQVRQPGVNLQPFAEPTTPVPGGPNPGIPQPPPPPPPPPAPPVVMPQPQRPPSHLLQPGENTQLELPGTFSKQMILSWFNNGDAVRTKQPLWGVDRDGKDFIVPKGMAGTVLWSDGDDTIASFDIEINGPLQPMTIRVEDSTDLFYADPKANPGFRRRRER